jgi:hypothetical protein
MRSQHDLKVRTFSAAIISEEFFWQKYFKLNNVRRILLAKIFSTAVISEFFWQEYFQLQ